MKTMALLTLIPAASASIVLRGSMFLSQEYPTVGENTMDLAGGGSCTYNYVSHAGTAVVSSASCSVTSSDLDHGTEPSSSVEKYARSLGASNDDAGHILANRLGGYAVPMNIFPQAPHINRGSYREMEAAIYECISNGSDGTLSWSFQYSSSSETRPTGVTYSAKYSGGDCSNDSKKFTN